MADFNYFLNRQGPRGMQGEKGEKGNDGATPTFYAGVDSGTQYTLIIDMGDGNTFETSNLMPTFVNTGGTYLRYDTENNRYVSAQADMADLEGNIGEVKLATTTSVANETVSDGDAVSYELFRQSGGGGGGTSFVPGTGLELTNANVLNVKIDNSTITTNSSGQLVAAGGGGGTTYTAGDAIDLTGNAISVKIDGTSIGLNASNELELKATIPAAQIQSDWTQADNTKVDFIKNKPTLGSLASKNTVDYTTDITNKPTLGSLAAKDTVDYTTDVTNKPTIGAGIITFTQGSTTLGTIDVNQTTPTTINIPSSGGGGGGSTYAAGNGIEISAADVISVKVDNSTIGFTAGGELELKATIPTDTGDLTNNAGYITSSALNGYATEAWVGNQGYLTGITSSDVTTALGYTPYSSANPNGYTSNIGTVTSVNNTSPDDNGNVNLNIPTVNNATLTIKQNNTSKGTFTANASSNVEINLTDTTYSAFTGADGTDAGTSGLVPAPTATDNNKFLKGDGTWQTVSGGGSATDVQIDGTSITDNGVANIVTNKPISYKNVSSVVYQNKNDQKPNGIIYSSYGLQIALGGTGNHYMSSGDDSVTSAMADSSVMYAEVALNNGINIAGYLGSYAQGDSTRYVYALGKYINGDFFPVAWIGEDNRMVGLIFYDSTIAGTTSSNPAVSVSSITETEPVYFSLHQDSSSSATLAWCSSTTGQKTSGTTFSSTDGDILATCTHVRVFPVKKSDYSSSDCTFENDLKLINPVTNVTNGDETDRMTLITNSPNMLEASYALDLLYDDTTLGVDGSQHELYVKGMVGATNNTNGTAGIVPQPLAGDEEKVLAGDGTWKTTSEVHCVIDAGVSGDSWYRRYDDGWLEQGGKYSTTAARDANGIIVALAYPYSNANYVLQLTSGKNDNTGADRTTCANFYQKDANGFTCGWWGLGSNDKASELYWYTAGYEGV